MTPAAPAIFEIDLPRPSARPVGGLSPAAVAAARAAGTYSRGELYHVCDGCRQWVEAIWWINPLYPRNRLCAACATAIGKGPSAREVGDGPR